MTDDELKAYARLGLTARLAELEREQSELRELLASIEPQPEPQSEPLPERRARVMSEDGRKRIGDAARRRWAAVRAAAIVPAAGDTSTPESHVARVLPRRGRLARPTVSAVPVLPPMPRLVKARAS